MKRKKKILSKGAFLQFLHSIGGQADTVKNTVHTFHEDGSKLSLFSGHLSELKESYILVKFKIAFIDGAY